MTPEGKKNLSESLKRKWASGTRKKNPPETYIKASRTHKEQIAKGRKKYSFDSESAKRAQRLVNREKQMEVNRRIADQKIGIPNPPGPSAKSPDHWKAKYWILIAPNKKIIQGWNLNELIRQNSDLFNPDDIEWYGKSKSCCRASKRLSGLFRMKTDRNGNRVPEALWWKGWTIGDKMEVDPK